MSMFGKPRDWRASDGTEYSTHARASDPDTSHEAVPVNITEQCLRVLVAYQDGDALLDHTAYRLSTMPKTVYGGRQRCTDLRHAGLIERTGERGVTPSGKHGYLCRITQAGRDLLAAYQWKDSA